MLNGIDYLRYNREKWLTIQVWFLGAFYRMAVLHLPAAKMKKCYGTEGEESDFTETEENLTHAWKIGFHVERIGEHTPWESKCLVRALTAHTLLEWKRIPSTLYLGVKKEDGRLAAHAWVRCGDFFVTGGDGNGYSVVSKFKK